MTERSSPDSEVQISYDLAREDKDLTVATICRVFENGFKVLAHLQGEDAEAFIDAWNARGAPAQCACGRPLECPECVSLSRPLRETTDESAARAAHASGRTKAGNDIGGI